jgi:branched-chain amino acid transport system permease protein
MAAARDLGAMSDAKPASRAAPSAPAWRMPLVVVLLGLIWFWLASDQLGLLTRIAYLALFVISLDLVEGIAGLGTLGHAAMFGMGAYAAGIAALRLVSDPLAGLAIGFGSGAAVALLSGAFLLRYEGFTFLMLTIAVLQVLQNLANKFRDLTGGDDGLTDYRISPLFGLFKFDLSGRTAAIYALIVLALGYYAAQRLVNSPFGLALRGINQNRQRVAALGTPVFRRLLAIYTFAGGLAGAAGAVSAQTNAVVALDSLGFGLSAEALVMLALGGAGRLHGALIGVVIFTLLHHTAASINPYHWLFVIGLALMGVVILPPARIWERLRQRFPGLPGGSS